MKSIEVKEFVKSQLATNVAWQKKALLKLYSMQTADEKECKTTEDANGRGFCGMDAEILSSFSEQLMSRGTLSQKQHELLGKKLPKYWKQIVRISDPEKLEQYASRTGKVAAAY